jgi:hypothetical protein
MPERDAGGRSLRPAGTAQIRGSRQDRSQDRTGNANPSQSQKTPMVHGVRESIL